MIKSLRLRNFKNFIDETFSVGPFSVIVGANASGKSNIRDALRFLHGVGRGYTLADILGGRSGAVGQVGWDRIRGAGSEIIAFGSRSFTLSVELSLAPRCTANYEIEVGLDQNGSGAYRVCQEQLCVGTRVIYTTGPDWPDPVRNQDDDSPLHLRMENTGGQGKYGHRVKVRRNQPALTQLKESRRVLRAHKVYAEQVSNLLGRCRFLDPNPTLMRKPAFPCQTVLGDKGENLATVLQQICRDATRRDVFCDWIRELTPIDVVDFEFPREAISGRVQLAIRERNVRVIPAPSASDGVLRFLSILAAMLGEEPAALLVFEELDHGIHPARLHLLVGLIERQTARGVGQVVTATHSPALLSAVNDETFRNTSVVGRLEGTDNAIIRKIASLPKAGELRKSGGLGCLLADGWMETALAFTECDDDRTERPRERPSRLRRPSG